MLTIREIEGADWPAVWELMKPVVRAGETYPYACDIDEAGARELWIDIPEAIYVALDGAVILGTYYIKPNQPELGAHVANCGYIVGENARGKGVATAMCQHSQEEALRLCYRAMQFNLVVKTNEASVYLWQKLGFDIVGTLPGAFNHRRLGFVDAYVMYKELNS